MKPTPLSRPQIGTRFAFVGHLELGYALQSRGAAYPPVTAVAERWSLGPVVPWLS